MVPSVAEGYCHRCGDERRVLLTVPWQDDVCIECGSADVDVVAE